MDFTHTSPAQRVIFSAGGVAQAVAGEVERLGTTRILAIAGSSEQEMATSALAELQVAQWFDDVVQHVPFEVAARAREAAAAARADAIVCVGGGSTTGLAKAVALTTGLPIIAVPTTYAGSEATNVWGMTKDRSKQTGSDDVVLPVAVIYDPMLTTSLPRELSISSGLNALAHCVDSLWAPRADPINRAFALEGARSLAAALPRIADDPHDLQGRQDALYGCYLAAGAFSSAGSGLHHKVCHVLGGTFDLPHAPTHAIVLPHVLALNAPAVPGLAERLAQAMGSGSPATHALSALYDRVGGPRRLADIGLRESDLPEAARRCVAAAPQSNPIPVTEANMTALLTAALGAGSPAGPTDAAPPSPGAIDPGQRAIEQGVVDEVLGSFDGCTDPRLKQLMQGLVRHAHEYLREVRLTQSEWDAAIAFLTDAGHITSGNRQEFVLLSDVLGLSMQTIAMDNRIYQDATEATVFGPFFLEGAPRIELGGDIAAGASGVPCWVQGTVRDTDGAPVPGARLEVWEADDDGFYDAQRDDGKTYGRAHLFSDTEGGFRFWGLLPTPYPIPHDGPVGKMLQAVGRSPWRAAHLHFMVSAPDYRTLVTHIFVEGDPQLDKGDAVFGVKTSLIKRFDRQPSSEPTPDGRDLGGRDWSRTTFDIVLAPAGV